MEVFNEATGVLQGLRKGSIGVLLDRGLGAQGVLGCVSSSLVQCALTFKGPLQT